MKIPVSFKFTPEVIAKLQTMAKATGLTQTAIIETLIEQAQYVAPIAVKKSPIPAPKAQKGA